MTKLLLNSTNSLVCPLCGNPNSGKFIATKDYNWGIPGAFIYLRCTDCGLVFQNAKCPDKNFSQLYPQFYGAHSNGSAKDFDGNINTHANAVRARTLEVFLASGALFDVGCGSGFFLEFMRRRGWEVSGLEPAKEHVVFAKEQLGLDNVVQGLWPLMDGNIKKVNAVSFLHVIEHLNHPVENLAAARDILLPGGLLLIETPNIKSWPAQIFRSRWVTLDAPRHLNLFSPDNLKHSLEQANFEILYLDTYSPSTIEYTESIRYALQDLGLLHRFDPIQNMVKAKTFKNKAFDHAICKPAETIKSILHHCERFFFKCINAMADRLGCGCNLVVVAKKC